MKSWLRSWLNPLFLIGLLVCSASVSTEAIASVCYGIGDEGLMSYSNDHEVLG
jgi:hypothetical protein